MTLSSGDGVLGIEFGASVRGLGIYGSGLGFRGLYGLGFRILSYIHVLGFKVLRFCSLGLYD